MNKVPITVKGAEKLREELTNLKNVVRPRITAAIAEARAHGDLKENADTMRPVSSKASAEGRIKEIEAKLSNCQIIDVTKVNADGKVVFGATVELEDVDTETL